MHYYSHHLGDYAKDTGHLSLAEHGAYRLLLDHYYSTETPLPGQLDALCRICRATSAVERQAVNSVLAQFFTATPTGSGVSYVHRRVESEIADYRQRSESASKAGKLSGEARRNRLSKTNDRSTDVQRMFNERSISVGHSVQPTNNQEPVTNPVPLALPNSVTTSEPTRTAERPRVEVEDWSPNPNAAEAESIVGLYPANGNRYEAQRAVLEAIKAGESPKTIRGKVAAHAARYRVLSPRDRQFCPALQTYFSEARWRDDPDSAPWTRHAPITRQQEIESAQKSHVSTEALF